MTQILVVDDDEAIRRLVTTILKTVSMSVVEANGADAAIEVCRDTTIPIDLILVDVVMPKRSGRHLAAQMAELRPQAKILLMSGYPNVSGILDGVASRSEKVKFEGDFLQKPFTPMQLIEKIVAMLANPPQT